MMVRGSPRSSNAADVIRDSRQAPKSEGLEGELQREHGQCLSLMIARRSFAFSSSASERSGLGRCWGSLDALIQIGSVGLASATFVLILLLSASQLLF
jgi:hypothetical protein